MPPAGDGRRLLALGRYSRAKGLDTVIRAVALVGGATLDVHGPALSGEEREHREELRTLVSELGLGGRVTLGDAVSRADVPGLFAAHDALVNNMRAGAPDKVVYEAAASCLPVLASNPVFDAFLEEGMRFPRESPPELAHRIQELAALDPPARAELGRRLRARVSEGHSVESWARGILEAAGLR
jgi:glycosyltransferase involved in cell wall biosynthesis